MSYVEHTRTEAHGFELVDATQSGGTSYDHDDLIWVGVHGEGQWLKADQVEQLAGALFGIATTHRARRATVAA